MDLNIIDHLPPELLNMGPEELHTLLPGPTLLRLAGEKKPPLFLSTLLHGDEPTGFFAIQKFLKKNLNSTSLLPRERLLFIGNPSAAARNRRSLPGQPDFNRIWNGGNLPEHSLARELVAAIQKENVFAAVDIHNSSGKNPYYACLNKLDGSIINLARTFSQNLVYFTRPKEVLSNTFSDFCPAVTLECGQPGDLYGQEQVLDFLEELFSLETLPDDPYHMDTPTIYHSIARIEVPKDCRIAFDREVADIDLCFIQNLDTMNFAELPENTLLGWQLNDQFKLSVIDEKGEDVEDQFFCYDNGEIRLQRAVVPSLLTTNPQSVYQDCLGYLMQKYALP
jgi:succinylglutamate desuccinylase